MNGFATACLAAEHLPHRDRRDGLQPPRRLDGAPLAEKRTRRLVLLSR